MKMTYAEIANWVKEHLDAELEHKITSRLEINTGDHSKYTYSNGDTYEWMSKPDGRYHIVTIFLNGEMVTRDRWEATWLENGNYGNKLIEELPIEENAVA